MTPTLLPFGALPLGGGVGGRSNPGREQFELLETDPFWTVLFSETDPFVVRASG